VDILIHVFLTVAVVGGECSDSRPGRFTPRERVPGIHWIGGWVDSGTLLATWNATEPKLANRLIKKNDSQYVVAYRPATKQ
jgi:hypothetical protein